MKMAVLEGEVVAGVAWADVAVRAEVETREAAAMEEEPKAAVASAGSTQGTRPRLPSRCRVRTRPPGQPGQRSSSVHETGTWRSSGRESSCPRTRGRSGGRNRPQMRLVATTRGACLPVALTVALQTKLMAVAMAEAEATEATEAAEAAEVVEAAEAAEAMAAVETVAAGTLQAEVCDCQRQRQGYLRLQPEQQASGNGARSVHGRIHEARCPERLHL